MVTNLLWVKLYIYNMLLNIVLFLIMEIMRFYM